jgi:hypothetical protein
MKRSVRMTNAEWEVMAAVWQRALPRACEVGRGEGLVFNHAGDARQRLAKGARGRRNRKNP